MTNRIVLRGVPGEVQTTLDFLVEQLRRKTRRNRMRADYYDGKRVLKQISPVVPPQYYRLGLVLGWSAKAVDELVRRCRLETFVWPDGTLENLGFAEMWEANRLDSEIPQALTSSLIHAVAFAITTVGGPGEPKGLLHLKSALDATGEWDPRARRLTNLLSITGRDDKGKPSSIALYLDRVTYVAERSGSVWEWDRQDHGWEVPAEALVYRPRLGRWAGSSRISRAVMALQDQAVRALVRMEGHMDVYSWPEFWMLGADESVFRNPDGSLKSNFQVMLGRVKGIPDDDDAMKPRADVKQFPAASPEPHLAAMNAIAKLFARETSLPDSSLAITDLANPTSAESYTASRESLIAEAEGATDDWTPPMRRAVLRTLAVHNDLTEIPAAWLKIAPKWRSPIHLSRAQAADAGAKILTAAPELGGTTVGLELLGLTDQQIDRVLGEWRRRRTSETVASLAAAAADARNDPQVIDLTDRRGTG